MSTHKKKIKIKSKNNTKTKINKNIPKAKKKLKLAKKKGNPLQPHLLHDLPPFTRLIKRAFAICPNSLRWH